MERVVHDFSDIVLYKVQTYAKLFNHIVVESRERKRLY